MKAIQAALEGLDPSGYTTYIGRATGAVPAQYIVLEPPGWGDPEEVPAGGLTDDLYADIRIKAVAASIDGVLIMLSRVRQRLSPARQATAVNVVGRSAWIQYVRSEFVGVDRDITIGTNQHPGFGVDTYHLTSESRS